MIWESELDKSNLQELYSWIDEIPLSKPKRKIQRDFSDGTMVAEIVYYYFPDIININNYISTISFNQKRINWQMLNKNVLDRFDLHLSEMIINDLSNAKLRTIEILLFYLKLKINEEIQLRQEHQTLLSLSTVDSINDKKSILPKRTSRNGPLTENITSKSTYWSTYEQLRKQCLKQQEDIEILQMKIYRLERVTQLKDNRINELSRTIQDCPHIKSNTTINNKFKKT
ncbi:unnamed protein product [Adineta steineri]|uniref:Calponin-homology (CH) domain-containing protein n=1 Tax=Adineta steineri TaxID=433720 RepID=A0A819GAU2_9BILA|nr:unnamed protein product [Adineta steineri]CAF3876815.1 unnamed protein product [Adineta steineri]